MNSWTKMDDEQVEILKQQKTLEEETSKRLKKLLDSITNPSVKLFLHTIILDTKKHADLYQMLISLNRKALLGENNRKQMIKELETHIKEEKEMLKKTTEIYESVKDNSIKELVKRILEDEKKHHKMLKNITTLIEKEGRNWNRYFYEIMKDYP